MIIYDTAAYAETRVVNTILKRPDGCFDIVECREGNYFYFVGCENKVHYKNLNTSLIRLGYHIVDAGPNESVLYRICRIPKRRDWRQGIRDANVRVSWFDPSDNTFKIVNRGNSSICKILNSQDTERHDYMVSKCRKYCIAGSNIFYRDRIVGKWGGNILDFKLKENFQFLKEAIEEGFK